MNLTSDAIPVASTAAQTFNVASAAEASVQVRFFSDAAGVEAIAAGAGSRTVAVTIVDSMRLEDADRDIDVDSNIPDSSLVIAGGLWELVGLGAGVSKIKVSASGGTNPAGAVTYRISVKS